jgi:hypothetical protein
MFLKGYTFTKANMRDHVRLTDREGRRVVKEGGSSALSYAEAQRFLAAPIHERFDFGSR